MNNIKFFEYVYLIKDKIQEDIILSDLYENDFDDYYVDEDVDNKIICIKVYISVNSVKKIKFINVFEEKYSLELVSKSIVEEKIWLKNWVDSLKPFEYVNGIIINPIQEKIINNSNNTINIIPGTAFGTGLHPTTKLAGKTLLEQKILGKSIIDVGCGTAILSILAEYNGAKRILGVDYDELAIEKAKETLMLNSIKKVELKQSNFLSAVKNEKFDYIVANMVAEFLILLLEDKKLKKIMKSNSKIILSGIMDSKVDKVVEKAEKMGLEILERKGEEKWNALVLQKKI